MSSAAKARRFRSKSSAAAQILDFVGGPVQSRNAAVGDARASGRSYSHPQSRRSSTKYDRIRRRRQRIAKRATSSAVSMARRSINPIALADYIEKNPGEADDPERRARWTTAECADYTGDAWNGEERSRASEFEWDTAGQMSISHPDPVEQVYNSITSTLNTIGAVASPKSDVKLQHLSGPVGIVRIYYCSLRANAAGNSRSGSVSF